MPYAQTTRRILRAVPAGHPMLRPVVWAPMLAVLAIPVVTASWMLVPGLLAVYAVLAVIWWPVQRVAPVVPIRAVHHVPEATWADVVDGPRIPPSPRVRAWVEYDVDPLTGEVLEPPAPAQLGDGR